MKTSNKIFSFDAETNGLWGKAFSIAAIVKCGDDTIEWVGRCPMVGETNTWVIRNVLPEMEDVKETHPSYYAMLKAFSNFYLAHKKDADIIVHMGLPVEARLFIDAHEAGFIEDWDAPYPLIDISAIPEINTSVDAYNKVNKIEVPFKGSTHHPLYDAYAALVAYENYRNNGKD